MSAALVAVDIGNTAIKVAWFDARRPLPGTLPTPLASLEFPTRDGDPEIPHESFPDLGPEGETLPWFVTSVNRSALRKLADWHATQHPRATWTQLDYRTLPIALDVEYPERVGMDRLTTSFAANWLREPSRPAIVVDAGTALKVHLVRTDAAFAGGAILPGLRLASESLNLKTDLLPRVGVSTVDKPPPVLGRDTHAAIRSGIYWGAVGAVRELVARIRIQLDVEPQVFITGGDAAGLVTLIDHDTRFVPHLSLAGIALLAHHHHWLVTPPSPQRLD